MEKTAVITGGGNGVGRATALVQHAFRMMKSQTPRGGRIINNGSVQAHGRRRNSVLYAATKHALTGLTRVLSLDGREFDIASGQIDIGDAGTMSTTALAGSPTWKVCRWRRTSSS